EGDLAYQAVAPTVWDVDFQTAVAQAELQDRTIPGLAFRVRFLDADTGQAVPIETTRPELLPACVGAVGHPDDDRSRTLIGRALAGEGALEGDPRPISHAVKFYEYGERPVEVVTSRQWFVRTLPFKDELLARGRELRWHPPHMRARYESWVQGLRSDWCISR